MNGGTSHHTLRDGWLPHDPEEVPLDRLSFGLSPREEVHDARHVRLLAEILPKLPPIVVHAPTMQVIDGVHRVMAARSRGERTLRAELFHGSRGDAAIEAVRRNTAHGKPLSVREREAAAMRLLEAHPEWSDRRIAEVCGLSAGTIARLRGSTADDSARATSRVGRDGKARPVDPTQLRHTIADALRADPDASIRAIARRTGAAQGTVRDVRKRLSQGDRIMMPPRPGPRPSNRKDDPAFQAKDGGADFVEWFESRLVGDDAEWERFVQVIPVSRIYEVADTARRCGETWQRFAATIESRVRQR